MSAILVRRPKQPFGGKGPKALPWKPLPYMEEYLDNLEIDEKSAGYIHSARVGLTHFGIFCDAEGIKHPEELERRHILRFQVYLSNLTKEGTTEPLSLSYRQQIMKYLRHWVNWLLECEHITTSPWVRIKIGRQAKQPKPLDDDEIVLLFDAHRKQAFAMPPFFYHRREVILTLLYGWGLRLHELAALDVSSMDMRQEFVTCRNKGGGTKVLPYADEMKQITQRWLLQRAKKAVPEIDSLLIDSNGQPLSHKMIYKIVTELGQRAGVAINPHRLRDSFGTKLLENDVPVERIMRMMGHTQREQTLAYARVKDHTLKSSHDAVMGPLLGSLVGNKAAPEQDEHDDDENPVIHEIHKLLGGDQ